jgi:hypothetical protein
VNPANWRQSIRDFLERHGGLKQTADGAGGGNRWMPVQAASLLDMMDKAVAPHGGRLTWFGIPASTSERHKEGIIDSLMDDIDERLDNVQERLDKYAERINNGEPVKGSALMTAKEDAATVKEIMALHGLNFGLDFVEIRRRASDLANKADDLHSSATSGFKAEVQEARKKAKRFEPGSIKVNAPKSAEDEDEWDIGWDDEDEDEVDIDEVDIDEVDEDEGEWDIDEVDEDEDEWDIDDDGEMEGGSGDNGDELIDW